MTVDRNIDRIRAVFGDSYDIVDEATVKPNYDEKVELVCPIHGPFSLSLVSILCQKTGCRTCGQLRRKIAVIRGKNEASASMIEFYKFFKTNRATDSRIDEIIRRYDRIELVDHRGMLDLYKLFSPEL